MHAVSPSPAHKRQVRSLLEAHYPAIGKPTAIYELNRPTKSNDDFIVNTKTGTYFVTACTWGALFGIPSTERPIVQAAIAEWSEHVRTHGIAVPQLCRNKEESLVTEYEGLPWTVEQYVTNTRPFETNTDIVAGAKLLADYHRVATEEAHSIPALGILQHRPPPTSLSSLAETYAASRARIVKGQPPAGIATEEDQESYNWICGHQDDLDAMVTRYATSAVPLAGQRIVNHGDMHPENVLWGKPYLIDFDNCKAVPGYLHDVAFSATRFGQAAQRHGASLPASTATFLSAYEQASGTAIDRDAFLAEIGATEARKTLQIINRAYQTGNFAYFRRVPKHATVAANPASVLEMHA